MDALGKRIVEDEARVVSLRERAVWKRIEADELDREADEIMRLLDLARIELPALTD